MSRSSSSTSKMRSPDAIARWYWPTHMPDRAQRQHQQRQVRVDGEELAQRQLAVRSTW